MQGAEHRNNGEQSFDVGIHYIQPSDPFRDPPVPTDAAHLNELQRENFFHWLVKDKKLIPSNFQRTSS